MTMFDSIIAEADEQFNLKGKAGTLLSALLALMTDGTRGGFAGFLEKFGAANSGDAASSWVNSDANTALSNEQLESALGADTLTEISNQIGTDYATTVSAAAFMTPRVVDALTPDGVLPQDGDLLSRIGGSLNGVEAAAPGAAVAETFDRIGTAAAPVLDADKKNVGDTNTVNRNVNPVVNKADDSVNRIDDTFNDNNNSPLGWLLPLLLLGLLLVLGYWFCSKTPEPAAPIAPNMNVNRTATNTGINAVN